MNQCDVEADSPMRSTLAVASDEALVISTKAGMHLAYAELCRRHSTGTFRTIHRITQSKEDAEDALQESLLKAFTHLYTFDGRSKFSTWLTRIAINSALMILRKKRAPPESSFDVICCPICKVTIRDWIQSAAFLSKRETSNFERLYCVCRRYSERLPRFVIRRRSLCLRLPHGHGLRLSRQSRAC
jgi:DNA-directed RNA polymerase specialized sigma24 family protein